jgi:crotonobetainyl-CoA:carnitine CoA-transferase CaiB-like acyl-CoA transferase
LPPFGLADGITGLATAAAISFALQARQRTGVGQVIDMAIIEPILTILGPQPSWFDQLGMVQERRGNRSVNNAPRNVYRTKDDRWVAISTSAQNIAERVMRLVGHPEVIEEPWFASGAERAKHADILDAMVGGWIAERPFDEVIAAFEKAEAAVAPIYDIRHIMEDPQFCALDSVTTVDDPELGALKMQNVLCRLSDTPGKIKWAGRAIGADNETVYGEWLGLSHKQLAELKAQGAL